MREIKAGELLWKFRSEKKISARSLSKGICTASAIANYESGERIIDSLLLERFLERMGIVPSNFALMLSEEEYAYYLWKEQCYRAVENFKWEALAQLLGAKTGTQLVGNAKVQEQFYLYMKAILVAEKSGRYNEASALLLEAAYKTIPDVFQTIKDKVCLGELEIQIVLLYLYYGLLGDSVSREVANSLFQELFMYCDRAYVEDGIKTKNYVRIVCLWMKYGNPEMEEERKIELCEKALKYLRSHQFLFDITGLLEIYIPLLEIKQSSELPFYKKQYEAFCEIMTYAGVESKFRPEVMGRRPPKLYLISEYLQYKRREKKLTQARTSEGVCEPETYSRLENGMRSPSPTNMIALAEKLEIGWHFYRGELDVDNRKVYQLRKKQRNATIKEHWQESLDVLQEMRMLLDMNLISNLQYICSAENMVRYRMNAISAEEAYLRNEELLKKSMVINLKEEKLTYYSQTELEIIGHMGQLLLEMKRNKEGIELLESVLCQMLQSRVAASFQWNGISFVMRVLSELYFSQEQYPKAYETTYQVYKETVRYYNGGNLETMLDSMSDSLEHIGAQHSEAYRKLCRLAYYVSDFYDIQHAKKIVKEYYEKTFEKGYEWYFSLH